MRPAPAAGRLVRRLPLLRWALSASVAVGLLSTVAVVVQALALAALLTSAVSGSAHVDRASAFAWLAVGVVIRGLCGWAAELLGRLSAVWTQAELRSRLLGSLLERGPGAGDGTGEMAVLAGPGIDALDSYVGKCLPDLVLAALAPLALVCALGVIDWVSALVIAVGVALFPVFGALVGRASSQLAARRWAQVEDFGRQVLDVFTGMAVLKAFGRSRRQRDRIEQAGEALRRATMDTLRVAFLSALVLDELASVSVALVAVPLGLRLLHGAVSLGAALAVLIVAPEVFLPLRRASAEFHQSTEGLAALDSVMRVLDDVGNRTDGRASAAARTTTAPSSRRRSPASPASPALALSGVRLSVPGRSRAVLDGLDLEVRAGETVALVGPNGAGKSSVLSLVLGFTTATSGTVVADGRSLGQLDIRQWRRRIAYLPEHPTLLAGTVADNLRLADPTADDAALVEALAAVGGRELLDGLDEGLPTCVGEGGRVLSAGERQRIALARIVLHPASLYLLDEPTVHLDAGTEAAVVGELANLLRGRSALVVTHRPAVLALADRVVTLDGGRVVADMSSTTAVAGTSPFPAGQLGAVELPA